MPPTVTDTSPLRLSRALLTPGPLPPLSHFGVTLLRHAVGTGLRYSLYHLGLPLPEAPPVRILRLRLYLDAARLEPLLAAAPGGEEVAGALLDPGGMAGATLASPVAAALAFHRARLRLSPAGSGKPFRTGEGEPPEAVWARFREHLARLLRRTNEAFLADLAASLSRRARRAAGEAVPPALSRAARRLREGGRCDLGRFGLPDPLAPSWTEHPESAAAAVHALERQALPPADPGRGRFREAYRGALTRLAPLHRELARGAAARGVLEREEDACFLPFDLADHLAGARRPSWLEAAVGSNRAEHESLLRAAEPLDRTNERQDTTGIGGGVPGARPEWEWGPLLPLP